MKTFITDDFLLQNKYAKKLYHDYAMEMPIIDYHCHLSPQEIAEDKHYRSITEMWLDGDHYKWRAIRTAGYTEKDITGYIGDPRHDKARFDIWAHVLPKTIGNPLYHWTHLELLRYFEIDELLTSETSDEIYFKANEQISRPDFSARSLINQFQVKFIGTTDDPIDSLEYHEKISRDSFECRVAPSWRPDKALKIELSSFKDYISALSQVSNIPIQNLSDLEKALEKRIEYFAGKGCCISDHGLDEFVFTRNFHNASDVFDKAMQGNDLTISEITSYKSHLLVFMGRLYAKHQWTMQLHIGALRNNNTRMYQLLGADAGFDSINDNNYAPMLSAFLDTLDKDNLLPKTILYSLNPRDNEMLGTMIGNFQGNVPGKIQYGSGWWFNDQKDGMLRQLTTLSSLGLLPYFIGMLTDSRSFLSFSRHEYFRRILCNLIGSWVEAREVPDDMRYLGNIVQDICFNNAKNYFQI
ncbi:MAG: glucuronate isomerase [Brevinema sp.]